MDFNTAINDLERYLIKQVLLRKVDTLDDLDFPNKAVCLLMNPKGDVYDLPDNILFKKAIFYFNEDPTKITLSKENPKPVFNKQNSIHSALTLFEAFENNKMIKSAYIELFNNYSEIDHIDNLIVVNKDEESYKYIFIKGLTSESEEIPGFLSKAASSGVYTFSSTPHTIPPTKDMFEATYRQLKESIKVKWSIEQIRGYLESIWNERSSSTILSRITLLFESTVLLTEKHEMFNQYLRTDENHNRMIGILSNFVLGICGGYARGEYSKTSDLDMLLIHEGNDRQFGSVGVALNEILKYVPNLELCNVENFIHLNFHEDSIFDILQAFLSGDETYINQQTQRIAITEMIKSIEAIRKSPLSPEERKDGISKYCWSIYKSIINMVPIYEKPLGKGPHLRENITKSTKQSLNKIIPLLLRISDSLVENEMLGESLKICQPYVYESIFKKYSVLTALQDLSTILNVLNQSTFTSSTIERFQLAKDNGIITDEQSELIIESYEVFSKTKYKLKKGIPIDAITAINEKAKKIIITIYNNILSNLDSVEVKKKEIQIAYPLLVFSDLHWGLNAKLAKLSLSEIKSTCEEHKVKSIIINGDLFNVDRFNEMEESDSEGITLLNELSQIQNSLGDQRIHIISGNHDLEDFYNKFQKKMVQELDIHFIGNNYKDENIWVEHGDLNFWKHFTPPMEQFIPKFREENELGNEKIIVGHSHRIYEEEELGFYGNGAIGTYFSSILVKKESVELIKLPIEYSINFDEILAEYSDIINADISINEYVQDNIGLVEWNQFTNNLVENGAPQKKTWIITEKGEPTGIIPFNRVEKISKLENIQVYEVAFPINYSFKLDQTLKEAWGVFSVTGDSMLPVLNQKKEIVGTLSIFSVPKPQKEHAETKEAEINDKMKSVGNSLIEKLLEKQNNMD
ncbi:MAG: metallophosphoesterase [Candidatus Kariarchaeaceae archaeon]|jgi:predicted phosphodiesterase/predicted nucleotidyltransferase